MHPGQLLRHLFPELFQAAHAEPVWSGLPDFWWRDKIRVFVFIPVFSRRASAEPFDGRGLGLLFEAPTFVLVTRTSRPEMFHFPRGNNPVNSPGRCRGGIEEEFPAQGVFLPSKPSSGPGRAPKAAEMELNPTRCHSGDFKQHSLLQNNPWISSPEREDPSR